MSEDESKGQNLRLESVFVLHRHSIRAPTYYAPHQTVINPDLYPRGAGYLTRKGIDICKDVAKVWQSWYPSIMDGSDHRSVFVRSSESPRCHETATALLHAVFSSGPEGLNPIPIYGPPPGYDKYVSCAGFDKDISFEMKKLYREPVKYPNSAKAKTMNEIHEFVKEAFNDAKANEYDAFVYVDGITSNIYENFPVPEFFSKNQEALTQFYHFAYHTVINEFGPFYGYHLMRGMASRMKQVYNRELTWGAKLCCYSFHDFSVSAVLNALEAEVSQPKPNFLGAIFFELLLNTKDGSRVVDVYYTSGLEVDGTYSERQPIRFPWNDGSHRVSFGKLYDKMFNNAYDDRMKSSKIGRYTKDDAMV